MNITTKTNDKSGTHSLIKYVGDKPNATVSDYERVYLNDIFTLFTQFAGQETRANIFVEFAKMRDAENVVIIDKGKFAMELGTTRQTVNSTLKELEKVGFMKKISRVSYYINPSIVAKGKDKKVTQLVVRYMDIKEEKAIEAPAPKKDLSSEFYQKNRIKEILKSSNLSTRYAGILYYMLLAFSVRNDSGETIVTMDKKNKDALNAYIYVSVATINNYLSGMSKSGILTRIKPSVYKINEDVFLDDLIDITQIEAIDHPTLSDEHEALIESMPNNEAKEALRAELTRLYDEQKDLEDEQKELKEKLS